jgi:two-component system, OmpR family, response regulator
MSDRHQLAARWRGDRIVVALPPSAAWSFAPCFAHGVAARSAPPVRSASHQLRFSGWVLDLVERRLVAPGGGVAPLPGLEFALLRAFVTRPRRVLTRAELAQRTGRDGRNSPSPRTVDVYVSRLRRILEQAGGTPLISTVWGAGYVFDADVTRI